MNKISSKTKNMLKLLYVIAILSILSWWVVAIKSFLKQDKNSNKLKNKIWKKKQK